MSSVLLPEPLGPTMAMLLPTLSLRLRLLRTFHRCCFRNIDAALKVSSVFDHDAAGFDIAHQFRLFLDVDLVDPDTLQHVESVKSSAVLALAVYFGKTRLIDNIRLP